MKIKNQKNEILTKKRYSKLMNIKENKKLIKRNTT